METSPPAPLAPRPSGDDKPLIILCHLSGLLGVGIILPLIVYLLKKDESGRTAAHAGEVRAFVERFQREHGFTLEFDSAATGAIASRAQHDGMTVEALCLKLFKDYPFGLKLVTRGSGQTRFVIPADAIANPDKFVSDLVVTACRQHPDAATSNGTIIDVTPEQPLP